MRKVRLEGVHKIDTKRLTSDMHIYLLQVAGKNIAIEPLILRNAPDVLSINRALGETKRVTEMFRMHLIPRRFTV